ncbi:MAG TPA: CoA transferase [Alphaproteobacteria bacterium]|nr:CoA transferase [Alphaproteobacteria bacterium]
MTAQSLAGLRIFDLTRILAGPTCTQLLGDLGADVIKIERPGVGDDTRKWGPPYLKDRHGRESHESAYYLSSNRNKRSLTLDIARPEGQVLARRLIGECDVMVENFKVGDMAKYGLAYEQLKPVAPRLVYCSITGFGQSGPYAPRAGYDLLAQGMGGIMSITGQPEGTPGSEPMKVGVGIADVMTGMYSTVAILAALRHRDATGEGQWIDMALLDTQVAWLINEAMNYLLSGEVPKRRGNAHPNIVPYQVFPAADGYVLLAVGNDGQYRKFCEFAGAPELADDPRFASNPLRVKHRATLVGIVTDLTKRKTRQEWVDGLARLGVPCSPVNDVAQVFDDPQIVHRAMKQTMRHDGLGADMPFVANPIRMSATPPRYRRAPPLCGQHTDELLRELLGLRDDEIAQLRAKGVV